MMIITTVVLIMSCRCSEKPSDDLDIAAVDDGDDGYGGDEVR